MSWRAGMHGNDPHDDAGIGAPIARTQPAPASRTECLRTLEQMPVETVEEDDHHVLGTGAVVCAREPSCVAFGSTRAQSMLRSCAQQDEGHGHVEP